MKPSVRRTFVGRRGPLLRATPRRRIGCIGDSRTYGVGAGTGGQLTIGAQPLCYPSRMVTKLQTMGFNARAMGIGEANNTYSNMTAYDTQITSLGSWVAAAISGPGGKFLTATATTTPLVYAPNYPITHFELYVPVVAAGSFSIKYQVNNGLPQATELVSGAVNSVRKITIPCGPPGFYTLSVDWGGGTAYISDIFGVDRSMPMTEVCNFGIRNWSVGTSEWGDFTQPYRPTPTLAIMGLTDAIIDLGVNAARSGASDGSSLATFNTNYRALIDKIKPYVSNSITICLPAPVLTYRTDLDWGATSIITKANFEATLTTIASDYGFPLVAWETYTGSWATMLAASETQADNVHLKAAPYDRQGIAMAEMIGATL